MLLPVPIPSFQLCSASSFWLLRMIFSPPSGHWRTSNYISFPLFGGTCTGYMLWGSHLDPLPLRLAEVPNTCATHRMRSAPTLVGYTVSASRVGFVFVALPLPPLADSSLVRSSVSLPRPRGSSALAPSRQLPHYEARPAHFAFFLSSLFLSHSLGHSATSDSEETICVYDRRNALERRADGDGDSGGGTSVGVSLPSVGLTLGNITTKLGNINLTVTNVTISVGNIDIENITIGNITIIVSVPLPGASPINAFSASTAATSISTSTNTGTSTVSPPTGSSGRTNLPLSHPRPQYEHALTAPVTVTASGGPINAGAGNVDTEIGNITIFVGNINVSVGDGAFARVFFTSSLKPFILRLPAPSSPTPAIYLSPATGTSSRVLIITTSSCFTVNISNVSIGNIFVLVQIGQPDLNGALGNLTSALEGIGS
ncbi:hypothetical protein K438DRAFT_1956348 [Mycena galopus ATCC 62051]|nr:hypothetical protein K438DRAFT_1956348 [Mycena galopus ATCC 62051]